METTTLSEQLRELAKSPKKSKASRLFEILDDVEFVLSAGVTHAVVVQKLAQNGLQFTLPSFENTLHRVRQKRKIKPVVETKPTIKPLAKLEAVIQEKKEVAPNLNGFAYESEPNKDDLI